MLRNSVEYRERILERAAEDLWGAAPYAVENLRELVTGADVAPAVRLRACVELLDRIGVTGTADRGADSPPEGERAAAEIIRERLDKLGVRTRDEPG